MQLDHAIRNRRSIRKFTNDPISNESIKEVIMAGTFAPSASNKQHWRFIVIKDKSVMERLYSEAGAQEIVKNPPVIIATLYSNTESTDNNANMQSVSAAVQNMLLKSFELGLGSCWVCGFGDYKKATTILRIPKEYTLMCLILLGKPALKQPPPPPKKDISEIVSNDFFKTSSSDYPNSIKTSSWDLDKLIKFKSNLTRSKGLDKNYEIYNKREVTSIKRLLLKNINKDKSNILFFLGYDGTLVREIAPILKAHNVFDCEFDKAIVEFVKHKVPDINYILINPLLHLTEEYDIILLPFTLEKYPILKTIPTLNKNLSKNGKLIILLKNKTSFYGIMYYVLSLIGMNNLENSIYHGPFEPISKSKVISILKKEKFNIKTRNLFLLPPELEDYKTLIDGYLMRHGKKLKLGFIVKPLLTLLSSSAKLINKLHIPIFPSTIAIIAKREL